MASVAKFLPQRSPDKRLEAVSFDARNHYDTDVALRYETDRAGAKWLREQRIVESLIDAVDLTPDAVVLDVPVGTGRFLDLYEARGLSVLGIDVSPGMLAMAAAKAKGHVDLRQGDIEHLPLTDHSVPLAVCIRFVNLVPLESALNALAELARVSSGHVIIGIRLFDPFTRRPTELYVRSRGRIGRMLGRSRKVIPHPAPEFRRALERLRLKVVRAELNDTWADGSRYAIFLLRVPDQER